MNPARSVPFELRTAHLLLRDLRYDDFDAVHAYATDPEVVRYMDWGPNGESETRAFLDRAQDQATANPRTGYELAIIDAQTGALLGAAGLHLGAPPGHRQAMLGYCLARDAWGRGVATEASRGLLELAFGTLGVHRVWASCDPRNQRSRRVLEKLGFRQEGLLRENVLVRSEWRDSMMYGLLRREWDER